jgi:hypothetical protein
VRLLSGASNQVRSAALSALRMMASALFQHGCRHLRSLLAASMTIQRLRMMVAWVTAMRRTRSESGLSTEGKRDMKASHVR